MDHASERARPLAHGVGRDLIRIGEVGDLIAHSPTGTPGFHAQIAISQLRARVSKELDLATQNIQALSMRNQRRT